MKLITEIFSGAGCPVPDKVDNRDLQLCRVTLPDENDDRNL